MHRCSAATGAVTLPTTFGVLLVTDGSGTMTWGGDGSDTDVDTTVRRGDACVVPHAAGPVRLSGELTAYFATPPRPDADQPVEFDA